MVKTAFSVLISQINRLKNKNKQLPVEKKIS
jgi:hypothetical protein